MSAVLKESVNIKSRAPRRAAPDPLTWQPSVSSARRWFDLDVGHIMAQRCFTETFVYAQISMNMLTSFLPFVVTSEDFSKIHDIIKEDFSKIDREFSDELARLDVLYQSQTGEEHYPAKDYTKMLTVRVPYYTREAGHVLALMSKFDDLLWRLDVLRFNELINTEQRTALTNRYKKLLMGLPRRMTDLWTRTRKSIERSRAAERAKKTSHAETQGQTLPHDLDAQLDKVDAELSQNADAADLAMESADDSALPASAFPEAAEA